jgi:polysaccharide pyruvyl transferase CsaB
MAMMSMDIGGAETHVLELCKALRKSGVEVLVASNGGTYVPALEAAGIRHFKAPMHNKKISSIYKSYKVLAGIIEEHEISLVHAHARIPAFICGLLKRTRSFRFVTTVHWEFTLSFPWNLLSNWGERSLAVSDDLKRYLEKSYKVPESNIRLTINGIDTETFKPGETPGFLEGVLEETELAPLGIRVLHVSRMDRKVNRTTYKIMEAVATLREEFPNIQLIIVGSGDDIDGIKDEAKKRNAKAGEKYIAAVGKRLNVAEYLKIGMVFAGVSRAALEAMASGLPTVLAGDVGGLGIFGSEKLETAASTNFTCRGCPLPEAKAIAANIREIIMKSPEERAEMGAHGRACVKELYSVERMRDDALELYESVRYPDRPVDAVISGYYGFNNNGDDIVLKSIINGLKRSKPDASICVLSMRARETRECYGVKAVNRYNFLSIIKLMRKTKLLITGGGSLIQDVTSTKSLVYYLWLIGLARRSGARNMLYANGIGPVRKPENIARAKASLSKVELITLRDSHSLQTLSGFGVKGPEIHVTADAAFSLDCGDKPEAIEFLRDLGITGKYAGFAVRAWKYNKPGFELEVARFADYVQEIHGWTALFIPMRPVEDTDISKRIISLMKRPGVFFGDKYSTGQIMGIVGMAEAMVGMRLHTLIYAAKCGTPVIGLVYDSKVKVMMDSLDQKFYRPVEDFSWEQLKGFADTISREKEEISRKVMEAGERMHLKAQENTRLCLELLEKPLF